MSGERTVLEGAKGYAQIAQDASENATNAAEKAVSAVDGLRKDIRALTDRVAALEKASPGAMPEDFDGAVAWARRVHSMTNAQAELWVAAEHPELLTGVAR